jgi:hypothetical protein
MSFDLAVWERRLSDGRDVDEVYGELVDRLEEESDPDPASPDIREFVHELLNRWPDLGEPGDEVSPWAAGPLMGEANGPWIYFAMTWSGAGEAAAIIADIAGQRGLVCYDPQAGRAV